MPGKSENPDSERGTTEQLGQITPAKQSSKDIALAKNRMHYADSEGQKSSNDEQCVQDL